MEPEQRDFRWRKACWDQLAANLPRPEERPPLTSLRLSQPGGPGGHSCCRGGSHLFRPRPLPLAGKPVCVRRRARQTCCEAAARVPEGWFGRGGGNRCWWRRPRRLRLCRAEPAGARPVVARYPAACSPVGRQRPPVWATPRVVLQPGKVSPEPSATHLSFRLARNPSHSGGSWPSNPLFFLVSEGPRHPFSRAAF